MPVYGSHLSGYRDLKLGQRIREERQKQGLTLTDLANKIGSSAARLSQVETERLVADLEEIIRIAETLNIPKTALLPEDTALPYQISRDTTIRAGSPSSVDLLLSSGDGTVKHHNSVWPLAELFIGRHLEPVLGRAEPVPYEALRFCYHHEEEFVFVLRGNVEFFLKTPDGIHTEIIHRGDCLYFCSDYPHAFRSADSTAAETLSLFSAVSGPIESGFDSMSSFPVIHAAQNGNEPLTLIGQKLRAYRDAKGWSPEQVSRLVGVSKSQLLQFELGKKRLPLNVMLKLARAYGKPLRQFMGYKETGDPYYFIQTSNQIGRIPTRIRRVSSDRVHNCGGSVYRPLASGFPARGMFPYLVHVPTNTDGSLPLHEHHGQEFAYVLEGELQLTTFAGSQRIQETLRAGDCCYLDSTVPHLLSGQRRNPYADTSAQMIVVFWCPLGERYLFTD